MTRPPHRDHADTEGMDHEGATVLVVEDEPSIADVLAIALRYHRFEVITAGSVRQAQQLAGQTRPDVALLDVMLP